MQLCKIIDDNHKNIVPIKDINSILKINKKVCSQVYLKECKFINDSYNKMVDKYKIIFLIKPSGLFLEHFWIFKLKSTGFF